MLSPKPTGIFQHAQLSAALDNNSNVIKSLTFSRDDIQLIAAEALRISTEQLTHSRPTGE
jgi:hypothetical protein